MTTRRVKIDAGAISLGYAGEFGGKLARVLSGVPYPVKEGQIFHVSALAVQHGFPNEYRNYTFNNSNGEAISVGANANYLSRYVPIGATEVTFDGDGFIQYSAIRPNVLHHFVPAGVPISLGRSGKAVNANPESVGVTGSSVTTWVPGQTMISYQQTVQAFNENDSTRTLIPDADMWVFFEGDVRFDNPLVAGNGKAWFTGNPDTVNATDGDTVNVGYSTFIKGKPKSLQWMVGGAFVNGQTGINLILDPVAEADAGFYQLRALNFDGTTSDSTGFAINVDPAVTP